jgi:hypothetical protein
VPANIMLAAVPDGIVWAKELVNVYPHAGT